MLLEKYLLEKDVDEGLKDVVLALSTAVKRISYEIKISDGAKAGSTNSSGEDQLAMDILADNIVKEELLNCSAAGLMASEEQESDVNVGDGQYAVAHDPLDGSSLLDVNFAVGTICSIYKADNFIGLTGRDQKAAVVACYGPSTGLFITVGDGTAYFVLNDDSDFKLKVDHMRIAENGKNFAPGNLRAAAKNEGYYNLLQHWMKEQYKLRYSGGFVPDVGHILHKGKGVFTYPAYEDMPKGKLRLLFECAPIAFIVEQAGGLSSDGHRSILDITVEELHQRTPIHVGSREEVKLAEKYLNYKDGAE